MFKSPQQGSESGPHHPPAGQQVDGDIVSGFGSVRCDRAAMLASLDKLKGFKLVLEQTLTAYRS
jgi:hypothetical protein